MDAQIEAPSDHAVPHGPGMPSIEEYPVIRPFGLRDVPAARRLQRHGQWLDLTHYLIHRRSALSTALIAPVPWRGTGLATYVWKEDGHTAGLIQVFQRPGRPEADILYVAPRLGSTPSASQVWRNLLEACVRMTREHELRRVYASVAEGGAETLKLADLGFAVYANEDLFSLARPPAVPSFSGLQLLEHQTSQHTWWLRRLYSLYTPLPVQQAEGHGDKDEPGSVPLAWWEMGHQRTLILADGHEAHGAVQVVSGRRGHWLLLLGNPADVGIMDRLVGGGLAQLAGSRWPVYCAVRDYQGGVRTVLLDHGFEPTGRRSRLVRHIVLKAQVPARSAVPALALEQLPQ